MINTSLDLVPPIRGLESFSFPMFFIVMEDGWWCFSLEVASIYFFLVWKKSCHQDRLWRSYHDSDQL